MRNASRICVSSLRLRETDLRVNVANCFTKSAPLAGERIVSDAPRSDWPAGRFVSPSPPRPIGR